jgi:pantothenate kinase
MNQAFSVSNNQKLVEIRPVLAGIWQVCNGIQRLLISADLLPLYPYLLVNIGSGVSIVKVNGDGDFTRVSGTNLGGGTFWGLCRLLTRVRSFDEMLLLSKRGNSSNVDMLVGDIYGGRDYQSFGLTADTIASSFGKVVSQDKELEDYNPAGTVLGLCPALLLLHVSRWNAIIVE